MYYYTYAYLRKDKTPYYIGKGKGNRIHKKNKTDIKPPKDKSRIIFLKQNLTEEEAFKHEIYMIAVFGRKDLGTGILHNKTDGGEGSSGVIRNQETRRKISISKSGKNHPLYGKSHSEETRKKMSVSQSGENHPNYGKKHSEETRKKMSEALKGKPRSKEIRRKISEAFKGKPFSKEHKKKLSEVKKNAYIPWNKGKKTNSQNASKKYRIKFNNGNEIIIFNLSKWCKENNYCVSQIYTKGTTKDIVAVEKLSQSSSNPLMDAL